MPSHELRDLDDARRFLLQSLWLQRVVAPRPGTVTNTLDWALELLTGGESLPPLGFIADVGLAICHGEIGTREPLHVPGWPEGLARTYEDHVLGKLYADSSFERAGDALRHYRGRDQSRGLAFLLTQFRQRAGFGGVMLSPALVKTMRDRPAAEVLAEGWDLLTAEGPMPLLVELYEELASKVRQTAGVLGPEDVFELEHRTALAHFSQRLALRQVLQAANTLSAGLPDQGAPPQVRRHDVPTHILDEDMYPVGGFSSLSNRGSIESLLHSQLALMENERPDLFDIKYLRDELLYYSRDENQFLRRRRSFLFIFHADLVQARFKDAELPWQRMILLLGLTLAATNKLIDWLSEDALTFDFIFVGDAASLAPEKALVETILRDQIANKTVAVVNLAPAAIVQYCERRAHRSLCQALSVGLVEQALRADNIHSSTLTLADTRPDLAFGEEHLAWPEDEDPLSVWTATLTCLLQAWV